MCGGVKLSQTFWEQHTLDMCIHSILQKFEGCVGRCRLLSLIKMDCLMPIASRRYLFVSSITIYPIWELRQGGGFQITFWRRSFLLCLDRGFDNGIFVILDVEGWYVDNFDRIMYYLSCIGVFLDTWSVDTRFIIFSVCTSFFVAGWFYCTAAVLFRPSQGCGFTFLGTGCMKREGRTFWVIYW